MIRHVRTQEDVFRLHYLGKLMWEESKEKFGLWSYDPDVTMDICMDAIKDGSDNGLFGWFGEDGEGLGFFLGCVTNMWFSHELVAYDYGLFIRQDQRGLSGAKNAKRLVGAWEAWAASKGAKGARPCVIAGIDDKGALSFFEKMAYKKVGTVLGRNLVL